MIDPRSDSKLAALAQAGDRNAEDVLMRRHTRTVEYVARDFFFPGAEEDDVRQEALIALHSAIHSYRDDRDMKFSTFVVFVVKRRLGTAVKAATRMKHHPLTISHRSYVNEIGERQDILSVIPDPRGDILDRLISVERGRRILDTIRDDLTRLERVSLIGVANGYTYRVIEEVITGERIEVGVKAKRVDNAVERARRKLREVA